MPTPFTVETERVRLTWSGPLVAGGRLEVRGLGGATVRLGGAPGEFVEADLALTEETSYTVLVQSLSGEPVALHHRDPVVTAGLVEADGGRVVHGRVRFGSQAGRALFTLTVGGVPEAEIETEVLPAKLTADEVRSLRDTVEAAASGLALAAVRPATAGAEAEGEGPSVPVWLAALRDGADRLGDALRQIDRRPILDTVRPLAAVRPSRLRRASTETRRAVVRAGGLTALPEAVPGRPPTLIADTPAHRWLAARLDAVRARLGSLAAAERRRRPTPRREVLLGEVEELDRTLARLRRLPVLAGAEADRAPATPPLVLRRAPAYAAAYEALRAIDRGARLRDGSLDVATQDLAVLFETWAALTVVETLADLLGAEAPARPFGVEAVGADVRLRRGQRWAVRFGGEGIEAVLVYNPRFPAPPALLVQRPDLVLTVTTPRGVRRIVLDAKYRRDDSAGYTRRHGSAGPPEDALGTLHRYRDAIVAPDGGPWIDTAVALFPGAADAAFFASRLWSSIGRLGVGAVPLRPGRLDAVRRFLADVLSG